MKPLVASLLLCSCLYRKVNVANFRPLLPLQRSIDELQRGYLLLAGCIEGLAGLGSTASQPKSLLYLRIPIVTVEPLAVLPEIEALPVL